MVSVIHRLPERHQSDVVRLLFVVLQQVLLEQGHYPTYIQLLKEIVSSSVVLRVNGHT